MCRHTKAGSKTYGDYDDDWEEYMIYGGLPQVAQLSVERQKVEYLKNIFTNVYLKFELNNL